MVKAMITQHFTAVKFIAVTHGIEVYYCHMKSVEHTQKGARVTAGPKRPHLGMCPGPTIPLQGRQGSRGCMPGSPGE